MLDHADCTAPAWQHELDHTDHTDHTDNEIYCISALKDLDQVGIGDLPEAGPGQLLGLKKSSKCCKRKRGVVQVFRLSRASRHRSPNLVQTDRNERQRTTAIEISRLRSFKYQVEIIYC